MSYLLKTVDDVSENAPEPQSMPRLSFQQVVAAPCGHLCFGLNPVVLYTLSNLFPPKAYLVAVCNYMSMSTGMLM